MHAHNTFGAASMCVACLLALKICTNTNLHEWYWNFRSNCNTVFTLSVGHFDLITTYVQNFEQVNLLPVIVIKHYLSDKQFRPWSDVAFCDVWSGSKLFAHVCQYECLSNYGIQNLCTFWRLLICTLNFLVCKAKHWTCNSTTIFFPGALDVS